MNLNKASREAKTREGKMNRDETRIGNASVAAVETLFGYMGNMAILAAFRVLANETGISRTKGILEVLKSLAYFPSTADTTRQGPSSESFAAGTIIKATFECLETITDVCVFLHSIAVMPRASMLTSFSREYNGPICYISPDEEIDFTPTLKIVAGLTFLEWVGTRNVNDEQHNEEYIEIATRLFAGGKDTAIWQYMLFMHIKWGTPALAEWSKKLATIDWDSIKGRTILEALRRLARVHAFSDKDSHGAPLFLSEFAREVAHKRLSKQNLEEIYR